MRAFLHGQYFSDRALRLLIIGKADICNYVRRLRGDWQFVNRNARPAWSPRNSSQSARGMGPRKTCEREAVVTEGVRRFREGSPLPLERKADHYIRKDEAATFDFYSLPS